MCVEFGLVGESLLGRGFSIPQFNRDVNLRALEEAEYERTVPVNRIGVACDFVLLFLGEPFKDFFFVFHEAFDRVASPNSDGHHLQGRDFSNLYLMGRRNVLGPVFESDEKAPILPGLMSASTGVVIATSFWLM